MASLLGEAQVVKVGMGEDDRLEVAGDPVDRRERLVERQPRGGNAGVVGGDATLVLDEVPVDERVLDAVDARRHVEVEPVTHSAPTPTTARAASSACPSCRSTSARPASQKPGSARSTPTIRPSSSGEREPPAASSSR